MHRIKNNYHHKLVIEMQYDHYMNNEQKGQRPKLVDNNMPIELR